MSAGKLIAGYIILSGTFFACSQPNEKLFTIRPGGDIGIDFQNTITTSDSVNALLFEYIYNGSGLGVGDFNNDGSQDLFFGGNQVSSALYLNQQNMQFRDVTVAAGVQTDRWITGVSVIDVNGDGWQDVYLSAAGRVSPERRKNLLFINQGIKDGIPVFKEMAEEAGLADDSYSTMAAFFDYDKDGDPDMYLVNNWLESFNRNNLRPRRTQGEAESTDKLYRNNGNNTFTDVSKETGILIEGYGLGVAICDINNDSWPDVYVANDFMSNDLLWINQHDGTFKNRIADFLKHQAHNGMGVDIADFNNDALQDILVVDMLPPGHVRQKLMTPGQNYDHFHMSLDLGYEPQYMRNTLQLNRGEFGDRVLFSEIAFQAGVAQTDWSWAPLFADFDNDGWKDVFIANGYRRDVTNLDFIFFASESSPFGTPEARRKKLLEKLEREVPDVKLNNVIYRNTGSLVFEDRTKDWGLDVPTFTNGAAYADLDNDGDLDLVTNNIDQDVIVYENQLNKAGTVNSHFIRLLSADPGVFNEKIRIYVNKGCQFFEHTPYRGFQSTVENYIHAGLGASVKVDSVIIQWPDNSRISFVNLPVDTVIRYSRKDALSYSPFGDTQGKSYFERISLSKYSHTEKSVSDIKVTRTLIHELSRYGPCLAKGDVNGDRLDDFFIGEEDGVSSKLFIQRPSGDFTESEPFPSDIGEVGSALFFDADGDNDQDLYIALAAASGNDTPKVHRLYVNDGTGIFTHDQRLPVIKTSASCVEGGDYDADGDIDLFVGGRISESRYPLSPRSYILRNENGKFTDVTAMLNPDLQQPGMVSSAVWADLDGDKRTDLVFSGEWQPIRVFKNNGPAFSEVTKAWGLENTNGWWNCLVAADLDNDGYTDILAGNTGKNSYFKPTVNDPVQLWAKDFDNNGSIDPVVTYYNPVEKDRFAVHNRLVLLDQVPSIKKRFETFTRYATAPFHQVFSEEDRKDAYVGNAYKLESVILMNRGGKTFEVSDMPDIAQISTVNDMEVSDVNEDGKKDIILIGNSYSQETLFGRYDASVGTILLGSENGSWIELSLQESGMLVAGEARYIDKLRTGRGEVYVIACNDDELLFYRRNDEAPTGK
jgi:hypothetical protein